MLYNYACFIVPKQYDDMTGLNYNSNVIIPVINWKDFRQ